MATLKKKILKPFQEFARLSAAGGILLFGATDNFLIAREFSSIATYDQKMALMRCLFAVAATDASISVSEEGEIHRIARELLIDQRDLVALRVAHQRHLPGISRS